MAFLKVAEQVLDYTRSRSQGTHWCADLTITPGIYYLRQCMAAGVAGHGQPQMILEQLCQLLRGSGRVSEEHLRMIAPRPRIGLFWG